MQLRPSFPLYTERLALRPPALADVPSISRYKSRADVTRWVPHGPLDEREIAGRVGRARTFLDDEGQDLGLVVVTRDDGRVVGDVVLMWRSREFRSGEIGYILDPDSAGHGYATEATRELLRLGFEELGLHRIYGRLYAANEPSAGVLRRVGMRQEALLRSNETLRGEWTDEAVFAMLEDEWRSLGRDQPGPNQPGPNQPGPNQPGNEG